MRRALHRLEQRRPESEWFFEDNYFDPMPGEVKTVGILGSHTQGRITAKPWYSPHGESVTWAR